MNFAKNDSVIFDDIIKTPNFYARYFLLTWSLPLQSFKNMPNDTIFDVLSLLKRLFQQQDNGEREKTYQWVFKIRFTGFLQKPRILQKKTVWIICKNNLLRRKNLKTCFDKNIIYYHYVPKKYIVFHRCSIVILLGRPSWPVKENNVIRIGRNSETMVRGMCNVRLWAEAATGGVHSRKVFIKNKILAQVFSCEFYKNFNNFNDCFCRGIPRENIYRIEYFNGLVI